MNLHILGYITCYACFGDLGYYPYGYMVARFRIAPENTFNSTKTYLNAIQGEDAIVEKIMAPEIDVLLLRNDPAGEPEGRGWAKNAPLIFGQLDRKSTRLNSSHVAISYAVFCLKKKKKR